MKRAEVSDRDAIMDFLLERPSIAMFPICNLRDHGMEGGHGRAMTFWLARDGDKVTDVLGMTDGGFVMPVFGSVDMPDVKPALRARAVAGIVGQAAPVAAIREMMHMPRGGLDRAEPHLELALSDLELPDTSGLTLTAITPDLRNIVIAWRTAYGQEALHLSPAAAADQAVVAVDAMIAQDSHRVLMQNGQPVSMTGFNARLPETVMIGGVYTPQALRGHGFARAALGLHLAQAQAQGVTRAVLSAASTTAAKVYHSLGFRQIGEFMIIAYDTPQVAHG
ncbi:GNAT family N-acetyltransferase [Yoonia sp. 208BN28-4]|uniref:GNAT family N-acetyltransferase n=1 Tax=Yoonia sp. 208BN28-4 TaxID=3126505 RepID=UPI0030EEC8AB